jgi:hypothetical protein
MTTEEEAGSIQRVLPLGGAFTVIYPTFVSLSEPPSFVTVSETV